MLNKYKYDDYIIDRLLDWKWGESSFCLVLSLFPNILTWQTISVLSLEPALLMAQMKSYLIHKSYVKSLLLLISSPEFLEN